jgi:hypothetical protein
MQDAQTLINSLPTLTQRLMQTTTYVASFFDHVLYCAGLMVGKHHMVKNKFESGSVLFV